MTDKFDQARELLVSGIRPALAALGVSDRAAEELLLGTAIQESLLTYRRQINGPARGLFQMEPNTHNDIWANYLAYRDDRSAQVKSTLARGESAVPATLESNDAYAAAMCRVHYMRVPDAVPPAGDLTAMANYWKEHYNTPLGRGRPQEFVEKWPLYVRADTFD